MLIHEAFEDSALDHAGRPALIAGSVRWSYAELGRRVDALAEELHRRGLRSEDRVAIDLGNSCAAVVAVWATLKAGGAFSCLESTVPRQGFRDLLDDLEPRVLLTRRERLETLAGLPSGIGVLEEHELMENGPREAAAPAACIAEEQVANLVYTSGSTGRPKAVVMTHRNVASAAAAITGYLHSRAGDRILCVLPLSFDYGLYQLLMTHATGGCLVLEPGFGYAGDLLRTLRDHRVTTLPGVPTLFSLLLRTRGFRQEELPDLSCITNTGAALSPSQIRELRSRFPQARIYSMYGLTECKRVSYLPPELVDQHPESVGVPMECCEVAVVGEDGQPVPRGEVGELVVRGDNVMQSYWRRPEETAERLRPGPWPGEACLWTGDLFRQEPGDLLYFVGRRDDVFKCRGEKVSPAEVEAALLQHPHIREAVVVPGHNEMSGTTVVAYVVMGSQGVPDPVAVHSFCAERLEPRKVPHRVRFLEHLPRNARGKIDRALLKNQERIGVGSDETGDDAVKNRSRRRRP